MTSPDPADGTRATFFVPPPFPTSPPADADVDGASATPRPPPFRSVQPATTAPHGAIAEPTPAVLARIIAIANQKGGVGKSTTAVNLGACLADAGRRVLVVDLDPQGNASTGLGIDPRDREPNTYHVLVTGSAIRDAIVGTSVPGLSALPSTIDLAGAEIELVSQFSRESRLARALDGIRGEYDFVLLDCPPSLGLLTVNALTAAGELLVPIQCEYYALEGLGQLLKNVRLVQQNVNPQLRLAGIVMTMFDGRTKLSEQVVSEVRAFFGDRVYDTVIPRSVRLSEAPGYGQPITQYDPGSRGAEAYRRVAAELLERPSGDEVGTLETLPNGPQRQDAPDATEAPESPVRDPSRSLSSEPWETVSEKTSRWSAGVTEGGGS